MEIGLPSSHHPSIATHETISLEGWDKSVSMSKRRKKKKVRWETCRERKSSSHSPTSCFMFNNAACSAYPSLDGGGKITEQEPTPHSRLLVWLLTHVVMLPCIHFIRPFQHPARCGRHGKIFFRALTPRSPPLPHSPPSPAVSGDMQVI